MTGTMLKIFNFIKSKNKVRAEDIRKEFNISRVMVHKYLLRLQKDNIIFKVGKAPVVYYTSQKENIPIIDQILSAVKKYNPEKVILFGSQADGTANKNSDYDIAIIKDTNKPYRERLIEVRKIVRTTTPIDFFVFNRNEINKYKDINPMIGEIMTRGKVLYEQ